VTRELAPKQRHAYTIRLAAGQFVLGMAHQRGVDLVVTVTGPDGTPDGTFDGPARGPEIFSFTTDAAGTWRIEVAPFEDREAGSYELVLERVEPRAAAPDGRIDQLFAAWDRPGSPGAAVAVARGGKVLYQHGYGLAQLEYEIPVTPETVFHVASVSKQFTAFAVTLLAQRGRLSLDDDVRKHLPELPDFGHTITIRHLIHHTSGLRDQWNLLGLGGWRLDDVITRDQILRLVTRQRELNFPPGERHLYCNTGYTLLAEIVARVTGQSFPAWTAEHLFRPLGMTRTHFHDDHRMVVPGRAYSYADDPDGGYRNAVLSYANAGATSLFTTVGDLVRWMHNFETGAVGGTAVVEQMYARGVLTGGDTIDYAHGLGHGTYRGLRTIGHGGADAGFRSAVLRFPEHDLSVAVLSNLGSFNPTRLAQQVAEVYLEDRMQPATVARAAPGPADGVAVADSLLRRYAGRYDWGSGLVLEIRPEGDGRLVAQVAGQPPVNLAARADSVFAAPSVGAELVFARDPTGAVSHLVLRQGGRERIVPRAAPFDPKTVPLAEFTGVYDSPELETTYQLVAGDTTLTARHVRHDPITLTPTAPDEFRGDTWFFGEAKFERDASGTVTGMRVSSGRVRNLLFVKRLDGAARRRE
jgi:CubicO group peptidase (beta-lactamase class C family)